MVILTTSTDAQSFKVIPRSAESSVTFELTDKSKRTTSAVSVSVTNSNTEVLFFVQIKLILIPLM